MNYELRIKKQDGFSLIELIVVITIIAVITAVGVVSFGGVNKKSRDAKRMADLERYRVALEMARQIGGSYPATLPELTNPPFSLMQNLLSDPKTGYSYVYGRPTFYSYGLYANMEDLGSTNGIWTSTSCSTAPCGCSSSGCNYQVLNP